MLGDGNQVILRTTLIGAFVVGVAGVTAGQYLAAVKPASRTTVAQGAPVRQSIEGLRSVLDPVTTGTVPSAPRATIVLDPCTGEQRKR